MMRFLELRPDSAGWQNAASWPQPQQAARLLLFDTPNAPEPVLVLEFDSGWTSATSGPRLSLNGALTCAFSAKPVKSEWSLLATAGKLLLERAKIDSMPTAFQSARSLSDKDSLLIDLPEVKLSGEIEAIRHFLRVTRDIANGREETDRHPFKKLEDAPVSFALVRSFPESAFGIAMMSAASWNPPPDGFVDLRDNSAVVVFDREFIQRVRLPEVRVIQALVQMDRASRPSYRRTLSIAPVPGRGFLSVWNERATVARTERVNARRATFIPEFLDPKALTPDVTGWWLLAAVLDDKTNRFVAASAQPVTHGVTSLRFQLKGIRTHLGVFPATEAKVRTEVSALVPEDDAKPKSAPEIGILSVKLDKFVRTVSQILNKEVDRVGGVAQIAFKLHAVATKDRASARLRFDEFDIDVLAVADTKVADRPLVAVATRSYASFLSPIPGATITAVRVDLAVTRLQPGGDGLAGRRSVDDDVAPSIIVPFRLGPSLERMDLRVQETPRLGAVDTRIEAGLYARPGDSKTGPALGERQSQEKTGTAIVVGNRPSFLLAVKYPALVQDPRAASNALPLATWTFDPNPSGGRSGQRGWIPGVSLETDREFRWSTHLPAQGIGEEMERAGTLADRADKPLDFRIGDPASIQLRLPATVPGVNRLFPWNAFRAFVDPLNAQGSPVIEAAHLELLFGMPCDISPLPTSAFILVDAVRRLGLLPLALPCNLPWLDRTPSHIGAYLKARENWAVRRSTYTSRVLLLEPVPQDGLYRWEPALLPSSRISCSLWQPEERDMQSPVADPVVPTNAATSVVKLRGGATWGIEQGPIFHGLFFKKGAKPGDPDIPIDKKIKSVDALMSELSLSSFGASGHVAAGFPDADAAPGIPAGSRISADLSYGKLTRYMVTRRGRIGVFGHPAIHVSVFERTTVPSEQFGPLQPAALRGRAIVRKVAEYVEVHAPIARLARSAAEASASGFVTGCAFPQNARINVRTDWGSNVGSLGWKVPLWNRAAAAAQPTVYPRPNIGLLLAIEANPANSDAANERAAPILNPDVMCFFTRTDGVDAASQEPVEGVDFTILPSPEPFNPALGSISDPSQLAKTLFDDPPIPPGFEAFTFSVNCGDEPVLISANRSDQREGVRARVHNVTVVRGARGNSEALTKEQLTWTEQVVEVGGLARQAEGLSGAIGHIADSLAAAAIGAGGKTTAELLNLVLSTPSGKEVTWPAQLSQTVRDEAQKARSRYKEAVTALNEERDRVKTLRFSRFATQANDQLTTAKDALKSVAVNAARETLKRLDEIANRRVATLTDEARHHVGMVDATTAVRELNMAFEGLWEMIADADPDRVRLEIERVAQTYVGLTDGWMTARREMTQARAQQWLGEAREQIAAATRQVNDARAPWLVLIGPFVSQLEVKARGEIGRLEQRLKPWDPTTFAAAVSDSAEALRNEVTSKLVAFRLPAVTWTAGSERVWPDVETKLRQAHELYVRFEALRVLAESRVKAWGGFPREPKIVASKLESELKTTIAAVVKQLEAQPATARNELVEMVLEKSAPILDAMSAAFAQNIYESITPLGDVERFARQQVAQMLAAGKDAEVIVRDLREQIRGEAQSCVSSVAQELKPYGDVIRGVETGGRLLRSLGDPPSAQELAFVQTRLAYVFPPNSPNLIQLSTTVARVGHVANQFGAVNDQLKAVGFDLPVTEMRNALLQPAKGMMEQFDFNKIFKDLGGMKLAGLFGALPMPDMPEKVRVRHEVDAATRRVRVFADVSDLPLAKGARVPVFDFGVLAVVLENSKISANMSIESVGVPPEQRQQSRGSIVADWVVIVGGSPVVTLRDSRIEFSQPGGLNFDIDPTRIQLADALRFLTELMAKAGSDAGGLTAGIVEKGFEAVLATELPALTIGTFAITNLSLGVRFALERDEGKFVITIGAFVGRRSAPFALTVFILGGGGFLEVDARYAVGGAITCRVALGINAAATVGIALGPIRGTVFAALGFALYYESGTGGTLSYEIFFLLRGTVSVLSLVTVCVELGLSLRYAGGRFIGEGTFRCTIKIGFFKVKVKAGIRYELGCVLDHEVAHLRHSRAGALLAEAHPEAQMQKWATEYVTMYV